MSLDMTVAVWSLVASVVSVLLAVIAIALSLAFYIQANRSNTAASQALARVETLVSTILQHAFGMIEHTLERVTSTASSANSVPPDSVPQTHSEEGDDKQNSAMNAEADALNKLYAAEMQLNNPMYTVLFGMIGGAPMVENERRRIRDLIAIKRAQLEKQHGVKFDTQPRLPTTNNQRVDPAVK
jgi:hypothetical protein